MYVNDSRRQARNPDAIARAHELLQRQAMALRHYEEGLPQRLSAERIGVSQKTVARLLARLNLAPAAVPDGTFRRLLRKYQEKQGAQP